jgi:hypothetical protein
VPSREEHLVERTSPIDEGILMNDEPAPPEQTSEGESLDGAVPDAEDVQAAAPEAGDAGDDAPESLGGATPEAAGPADAAPPAPPAPYRPPAAPLSAAPAVQPLTAPPAPPVAAAPRPGSGGPGGGETVFTADYPGQSSRLWALLYLLFGIKGLVMIVHVLVLVVLMIGQFVVFVIAQAIVLFTAKMPEGMHRFQVGVLAQTNKINGWTYGLTDTLPPLMPSRDAYPLETSVGHPAQSSRLWALLNILLVKGLALLPHLIVLYVLGIAVAVVVFIAQIAILVTGRFPRGMYDFVVGVMRWQTRVSAFMFGLRDEYPRFSLE